MFFFALLGLVTMGLLAAEAFGSRRMNRSLWREGFMLTVTHERLGIGSTPSEVEGRPASPWRAEVWLHGEEGQLPRSLPFVTAHLGLPPPARVHLLDGSLYTHAGPADYRELDCVVGVMVGYARRLSVAARALRGQAFEAVTDQTNGVDKRLQALDLLLTHFPGTLEADLAAREAVLDVDPAVRLRAARALGEAGRPVAQAILLDDESCPEPVRAAALDHLARVLPNGALVPLLIRALKTDTVLLRLRACEVAGQLKIRDAVPVLLKWLQDATALERRHLLFSLGRIGDGRAEAAAVAHLDSEDPDVGREAVRCLGRVGRPSTVVTCLRDWLNADARPEPIRELAEAVVRALGRPVDGRGRLSLVTDDGLGAVSVPDAVGAFAMLPSGLPEED